MGALLSHGVSLSTKGTAISCAFVSFSIFGHAGCLLLLGLFSSCGEGWGGVGGYSLVVVVRFLIAVASLASEDGV